MTAEQLRGRRITRVIAAVIVVPFILGLAAASVLREPVPAVDWLQTLIAFALAWFLIKGHRWTRVYIIFTLTAGLLIEAVRVIPAFARYGAPVVFFGGVLFLIPASIYLVLIYTLSKSSAVRAYFERDTSLAVLDIAGSENSVLDVEPAGTPANGLAIAFGASLVVILFLLIVIAGFIVDRNRLRTLQPQVTTTISGARAGTVTTVRPAGRGATPAQEDCVRYDPTSLNIRLQPPFGNYWVLSDANQRLETFASLEDASNALALAQQYTMECFIGRHALNRQNRTDYLLGYWKSPVASSNPSGSMPSGSTHSGTDPAIANERCTAYAPSRLRMNSAGASGWVVTDGSGLMLTLDNESDASAALALARQHHERCWIGQFDDRRAVRISRVDYWK